MEFEHEFTIPTDVETAFAVLTDLERVAPCLPGARLEGAQDGVYEGRVQVKVGPMQLTYRGQARLVEADPDAHRAVISAAGSEARGSGTAAADIVAVLAPRDGATLVTVRTDLQVTGKPAQFGHGVMAEVGGRIIETFAERLSEMLRGDANGGAAAGRATGAPADEDALDLVDVAGRAALRRAAPVAALLAVVAFVAWWTARRR